MLATLAYRIQNIARPTPMLLPPALRDRVAEDDLVHCVLRAVEGLRRARPITASPRATAPRGAKGIAPASELLARNRPSERSSKPRSPRRARSKSDRLLT